MVLRSPTQTGWAAHNPEHPVDTYWETRLSNGKPQETAANTCTFSASLVRILTENDSIRNHSIPNHHSVLLLFSFADSGRSIVCAGRNTTLQCGSGQVLMIDGSFYGRENMHYCRPALPSPTTSTQHPCDWVDVAQSLTGKTCSSRFFLFAIKHELSPHHYVVNLFYDWCLNAIQLSNLELKNNRSQQTNSSSYYICRTEEENKHTKVVHGWKL